ncbi:hypothetical protein NWF32_16970 [Pseudomonas qingdaonensis]|nr:hypothetical protein [Pseudomonas qingdaonensis]
MSSPPLPAPPHAAPAVTPQDILDRLARREISQQQARDLLRSML